MWHSGVIAIVSSKFERVVICDSVNGLNISCTEIPTVIIYSLNAR